MTFLILSLRCRTDHKQIIDMLCMVFDKPLLLEVREYVRNILWFISERIKSWEKQIYRQRVCLLIQHCSHHFHSSHSYLLCIAWNYLFWEGKSHLADTSTLLLSTKITIFPSYLPLVWKLNNYFFFPFSHDNQTLRLVSSYLKKLQLTHIVQFTWQTLSQQIPEPWHGSIKGQDLPKRILKFWI